MVLGFASGLAANRLGGNLVRPKVLHRVRPYVIPRCLSKLWFEKHKKTCGNPKKTYILSKGANPQNPHKKEMGLLRVWLKSVLWCILKLS